MTDNSQPESHTPRDLEAELVAARKENEALRRQLGPSQHKARRVMAWALLVLGLIAVIPAEMFIWANRTVTNTDQYVKTVTPIVHEASVQKALQKSATDAIFSRVDVQQYVAQLLPDQAQPLAAPIATQVKNYTSATIGKIVASDRFAELWVNVNRQAQTQFMNIARNSSGNANVNVDQLYQFITSNLAGTPLAGLAGKQLPAKVGEINVVTIPALANIPHYVATLSDLTWVFLGATIGLLILALAVAIDRRRMTVRIGLGWMVVTILGVIAVRVTRSLLLGQITDPVYNQAAVSVWQALLTPLYLEAIILFLIGAVVAVIGWFLGPSRVAVSWRAGLEGGLGAGRSQILPAAEGAGWTRFLRQHHSQILWVLLIVTIAVLLALTPLNVPTLVLVLVVAGVLWVLLEFLVAPAPGKRSQ